MDWPGLVPGLFRITESNVGTTPNTDLSADEARRMLEYSADTGVFRWRVARSGGVRAGAVAGHVMQIKGYIQISIRRRRYVAHRLAWLHHYGQWPARDLDHINGNRADNRIANLREIDPSVNQINSRPQRAPELRGIQRHRRRWVATGSYKGQRFRLGLFASLDDAVRARKAFELRQFGEVACRDPDRPKYRD